ncbi:hypothetical protein Sango_2731100 [Sesamum angolense]|uniref:Uncharacterized protein n=1 Tax=Sesamum angolense TaxID=2727404 RepID=A0AAE1T501_9LAMI|nr:hypothetical protein Sango_2731100 [Sesamum angolense]
MIETHGGGHGLADGDPWRRGSVPSNVVSMPSIHYNVVRKLISPTLSEGFLPGERLTFNRFTQWYEDNKKVCSVILDSTSNEIQKQYERYEDIWLIMHYMKELYAVPDWHIRYDVMKAFFGARMTEGSSVREHGVMMICLVEKFKDLHAHFEKEETYIDVILQSLPPSLINSLSTIT